MLLDRGRLIVVQGSPAALRFLKLNHHASSAKLVATQTDPTLRGPRRSPVHGTCTSW